MALEMDYEAANGASFESVYWKVVQLNICIADKTALVTVYGYIDKAAADARKAPIGQQGYGIAASKFDEYFSSEKREAKDPVAEAYRLVKEVPIDRDGTLFFAEAADV